MRKMAKALGMVSRRAALVGGFSMLALPSAAKAEERECQTLTEEGNWSVRTRIHGRDSGIPVEPDKKLNVLQHISYHDSKAASKAVILNPYLSFTFSFDLDKDTEVTSAMMEVDASAFAPPINNFALLGGNPADNPYYWPDFRQRGGMVISTTGMQEGDRIYISFVTHSEPDVVFAGTLTKEATSTSGMPQVFYKLKTNFKVDDTSKVDSLMRMLRGNEAVQVETGVVRASGDTIPMYQVALNTSRVDQLYMQAVQDLRAMEAKTDANDCLSPGCFLTTACCSVMGRPDDCFELTTLRQFRDGWLAAQDGGPEVIARYYRIAPQISQSLEASASGRRQLRRLYFATVLPCVAAARLGLNRLAYHLYQRMLRRLMTRALQLGF